jgi:hypothetical protein
MLRLGFVGSALFLIQPFVATAAIEPASDPVTTPSLVQLSSDDPCHRCTQFFLPGAHATSPHAEFRIDSDLPEIFETTGVLYTTRQLLPPFLTQEGVEVPENKRLQIRRDFEAITGPFEVYIYHLSREKAPGETRRIVTLVRNVGEEAVELTPRDSMHHGPNAGQVFSVESKLAIAVLREEWDRNGPTQTVEPGGWAVVSQTKAIGAEVDDEDQTRARFITGIVRCDVHSQGEQQPKLEVWVIAIDGSARTHEEMIAQGISLLNQGAKSGESTIDFLTMPSGCQVRRVCGVGPNVLWRSERMEVDVNTVPTSGGIPFRMAMFGTQSKGCEFARQSVDLFQYPSYAQPDSVGNYMMEYHVQFALTNPGSEDKVMDVRVGKDDAPIGIALQHTLGEAPADYDELSKKPVRVTWAGPRRVADRPPFFDASLLAPEDKLVIPAGTTRHLDMRLMVVGTSSLPYVLMLTPAEKE